MVNSSLAVRAPSIKPRLFLGALAAAAILVLSLCLFFEPRWETNDDVAMSMVAHGYGLAAIGSPHLIFSNVLWGHLVRAIPAIRGTLGYSIATLGVLIAVGTVVFYCLYQLGAGYFTCLSTLTLILVRPVLFPQFTINAGLLLCCAVLCWQLYAQQDDRRVLAAGCLFALLGYLVRGHEFWLAFIVALPLIPWRALRSRPSGRVALSALLLAISVATVIDHQAYQGDEWKRFNELNLVRAAYTDFGAGQHLKLRADIVGRHGYSVNDIALVESWFFVDYHIANPEALQAMLAEFGPLPALSRTPGNIWIAVKTFWHPSLLVLSVAALLLAALLPNRRVGATWGLCIGTVTVLGLVGRPGVVRVYVPLVCLLLVAPFLMGHIPTSRKRLAIGILVVAAVINTSQIFSESRRCQIASEQVRSGLSHFPSVPVVTWGAAFPLETAYPVLGGASSLMSARFYALGVFTLAPFSVAFAEQQMGRGMTELLVREAGIPIVANPQYFGYLETYCREHLHGQLQELAAEQYGSVEVSWRQCKETP